MWWHGWGGGRWGAKGRVERRKGNEKTHETVERRGKHSKQSQRHTASPWHWCLPPSLACKQEICAVMQSVRLLAGSPELAWGPHCSALSYAGRQGCPVYLCWAPQNINTTCARGDTLCSKQNQPDCRAGWKAGCSNPTQVRLRACLYTPAESKDPGVSPSHSVPPGNSSRLQTCFTWPGDIRMLPLDPEPCDSPTARMILAQ